MRRCKACQKGLGKRARSESSKTPEAREIIETIERKRTESQTVAKMINSNIQSAGVERAEGKMDWNVEHASRSQFGLLDSETR
jgi:hypothetical protein